MFPKNKNNIFFEDPDNIMDKTFKHSSAVLLKNNNVDTTLIIDVHTIDAQFETIKNFF